MATASAAVADPPAESVPTHEPPAPGAPAKLARVLHVINGEHYSGAERVQDLLGSFLPHSGYEAGFACLRPGRFAGHRQSHDSPLYELEMTRRWDLRPVRKIAQIVEEEGYEILHAHTPRSLMIAALAARRTNLPLVYHVHSPASRDSTRRIINWLNDRLERWCAKHADRVITVSPTLTDHMRSIGYSPDQLQCVFNGVPALEADASGARRRTQPVGPFVLGMVALFRPRKGAEVLLDALAEVRSRGHDVRLQAVGPFENSSYEVELCDRVHNLHIKDAVHWTGFQHDVGEEMARFDALVLPSLFGEGMPMVILEAMAAGLPVVATRCEGVCEAVLHGQTGLVVEPGSVTQLADALEKLVSGALDYETMSDEARTRHAERFSAASMARQIAEVYDGVLARRG